MMMLSNSGVLQDRETPYRGIFIDYSTIGQDIESGGSGEILNYNIKRVDPLELVTVGTSWKFTAPITGPYKGIASALPVGSTGWAVPEALNLTLRVDGVTQKAIAAHYDIISDGNAVTRYLQGGFSVWLETGQYINILMYQASGGTLTLNSYAINGHSVFNNVTIWLDRWT